MKGTDFEKFRTENPGVERLLVDLASQVTSRGMKKVGFDLLWGQVRWFFTIRAATDDAEYNLNDHLRPFWARMLMCEYPAIDGLFDTRKATEADDWAYAKYGRKFGYLLHAEEDAA